MQRPRILIVENSVAVTGALQSILRCCTYMNGAYEFVFLIPDKNQVNEIIHKHGFETHSLRMREIRKNILAIVLYFPILILNAFRFFSLMKKLDVKMIVVNDFYNLIPSVYKMMNGQLPYVAYVRFMPSKFSPVLIKFWMWFHLRYSTHLIAVSNAVKKELPSHPKISVIYNELPVYEVEYCKPQSKIILCAGNYIHGKGQQYAIQSFGQLCKEFPDWRLRFVGGDMGLEKNRKYKRELLKLVNTLGIKHKIEWADFVEQMSVEYQKAAFIVNYSESESFSLTCLEALYHGRPVVATRSGGPEEIIVHNQSGYLVDVGNVPAMITAMRKLMSDEILINDMGSFGFNEVRIKFSRSVINEKMTEVFQTTLSQKL